MRETVGGKKVAALLLAAMLALSGCGQNAIGPEPALEKEEAGSESTSIESTENVTAGPDTEETRSDTEDVSEGTGTIEGTKQSVILGDARFQEYLPLLQGKRVALFSNHTGIVGDECSYKPDPMQEGSDLIPFGKDADGSDITYGEHILDALIRNGIDVVNIFCPEHGFRGNADAGEMIDDSSDPETGIPIISLYGGNNRALSSETMDAFDTLVVDIQDVGLRYYTYYITMTELMEACAENDKEVVILDRPNPNGFYVDGPVLREEYFSNVGGLPISMVHGLTLGEMALMINGEGYLKTGADSCNLTVIPCENYDHNTRYYLIKAPSPNLKDMRAVYLYASTCFFENTAVSVGRGTDYPFETFGSPYLAQNKDYSYTFIPMSIPGAGSPPFEGQECYGRDLRLLSTDEVTDGSIKLDILIDTYKAFSESGSSVSFFGNSDKKGHYWLDYLIGNGNIRQMIEAGASAAEIMASWQDELESYKKVREKYLLYTE